MGRQVLTVDKVKSEIHARCLRLRSLDRILAEDSELAALELFSSQVLIDELVKMILEENIEGVKMWKKFHPSKGYYSLNYLELRFLSMKRGIANYSRKSKEQLIAELEENDKSSGRHTKDIFQHS